MISPELMKIWLLPSRCSAPNQQSNGEQDEENNSNEEIRQSVDCSQNPEAEDNKKSWSYDETLCLISSMESHIEDSNHPKKRKDMFRNVANDLNSNGFTANAALCQSKWKSLLRSYKLCKDQKIKTGKGPSRFNFFNQMDALLGDKPSNKCLHSIESSEEVRVDNNDNNHADQTESDVDLAASTSQGPPPKRRRQVKTDSDTFASTLLAMKKEEYKKREERHQKRCALEEKKIELLSRLLDKYKD